MSEENHYKATKLVSTIGPATESEEQLEKLVNAGMNVARFNAKHVDPAWHQERIQRVRAVADRLQQPIGVLLDLQGPEIRLDLPDGIDSFEVQSGDVIRFTSDRSIGGTHVIYVPQEVIDGEEVENTILIDDGVGEFFVTDKYDNTLHTTVADSFVVKKRKTVNTPGVVINTPSLIPADLAYLDMTQNTPVDFIALSFVRNKEDIGVLREEMAKRNIQAAVVAKIENQAALDNLDEIIQASDAVMVARGDLAVEVPYEQLVRWQKDIIQKSREYSKPVITATQMLKSMVENPVPTRAEVSDISHAVYDGTDAVMLSEETTIGNYPVKAVKTQARIVNYAEDFADAPAVQEKSLGLKTIVMQAAVLLLDDLHDRGGSVKIDKTIVLTVTGLTARYLAKYRDKKPIYALTNKPETYRQLALAYGVTPFLVEFSDDTLSNPQVIIELCKEKGFLNKGETALIVHGTKWREPGLTNSLRVLEVE